MEQNLKGTIRAPKSIKGKRHVQMIYLEITVEEIKAL